MFFWLFFPDQDNDFEKKIAVLETRTEGFIFIVLVPGVNVDKGNFEAATIVGGGLQAGYVGIVGKTYLETFDFKAHIRNNSIFHPVPATQVKGSGIIIHIVKHKAVGATKGKFRGRALFHIEDTGVKPVLPVYRNRTASVYRPAVAEPVLGKVHE